MSEDIWTSSELKFLDEFGAQRQDDNSFRRDDIHSSVIRGNTRYARRGIICIKMRDK